MKKAKFVRFWEMMMWQRWGRAASLVVFAFGIVVLSSPTAARGIRVDFGAFNYAFSGEAWSLDELAVPPSPLSGTLPFAIDFGTGDQTAFCLYEDGIITFGSATCAAIPAGDTLEPLAANWDGTAGGASITYNEGNLARGDPTTFPANPLDAPQAVRFTWFNVPCTTCGVDAYSFQAVLIDLGGGDFDLELNYNDIPPGVGTARFALGPNPLNTYSFGGPFSSTTDYDFQFRNGTLVTTAVPEPSVSSLLALACAMLAVVGWRRRVSLARN